MKMEAIYSRKSYVEFETKKIKRNLSVLRDEIKEKKDELKNIKKEEKDLLNRLSRLQEGE